jgi:hypothetical protein
MPKKVLHIGIGLVALCIFVALVLKGVSLRTAPEKKSLVQPSQSPVPLTKEEVQGVVNKVGKHMVLPNEVPQIVGITNVDSLKKQQVFFSLANNGDQLLVYSNKVILYRPSTDQVVDVAQIRVGAVGQSIGSSSGSLR